MEYEWDETKNAANKAKHKLGFETLVDFGWSEAILVDRSRHADGEQRFAGIGPFRGKLYTVIFTWREGRMRIISFRRANKGEEKLYEERT